MTFLDREEELYFLERAVRAGDKVLIVGLRGYGKTSLAKELHRRLQSKGVRSLFVDCLRVMSPEDLSAILREEAGAEIRPSNPRDAFESFFLEGERAGVKAFILDEFTALFRRFGALKPYRGAGGPRAVAEHFKSVLDELGSAVIALDTSFKDVAEFAGDYTAPLFRQFTRELKLGPLPLEQAVELALIEAKKWGLEIDREAALKIAELSAGVPFYIIVLTRALREGVPAEKVFEEELSSGFLNEYFSLLMEKFSPTEQQVLYLISRGKRRFREIDEAVDGAAQALESLRVKGIVERVEKSKRFVSYAITDRVFEAWLAMSEHPRLKRLSFERVYVSSISFEALVREVLFRLRRPVRLRDVVGREVTVGPYRSVTRLVLHGLEVDALAEREEGYDVFEVYFGFEAGEDKLNQLLRASAELRRIGYRVENALLVSYFGFKEGVVERARSMEGVFLLEKEQIKRLAREAGVML